MRALMLPSQSLREADALRPGHLGPLRADA